MVGTAALLVASVADMRNCEDHAGATTGLPEIPFLATALPQWCSDESFPVLAPAVRCDTKDQHPQTWVASIARGYYFTKKYGDVHGIYIFSDDTPFGHSAQFATVGALRDLRGGVKSVRSDQDFGISAGSLQQSEFTTMVQAIKAHNSNYALCTLEYECAVLLRKEAALQGVTNQVKVWDCISCYDKKFLQAGGADVEHEYVDLESLPFYDPQEAKANPMLANFVRYTGKDNVDSSGAQAWATGVAFRDAVNAVVKTHGVNGLTRANLLAALNNIHHFDAGGMIAPIDLVGRKLSDCHVLTQVRNGMFVRVEPTKPGTFDCNPKYVVTRKLDLQTGSSDR
jgi:ABC-type branched-subunit amino acid transport system substrate-binding protein